MNKWFLITLLVMLMILAACGNESANDSAGSKGGTTQSEAEKVFQNNCAYCHGSDLSGGAGPALTEVGSRYTEEEIAEIIINGKKAMPEGLVEGEKVELLASWLAQKK